MNMATNVQKDNRDFAVFMHGTQGMVKPVEKVILQVDYQSRFLWILKGGTVERKCGFRQLCDLTSLVSMDAKDGLRIRLIFHNDVIELESESQDEKGEILGILGELQNEPFDVVDGSFQEREQSWYDSADWFQEQLVEDVDDEVRHHCESVDSFDETDSFESSMMVCPSPLLSRQPPGGVRVIPLVKTSDIQVSSKTPPNVPAVALTEGFPNDSVLAPSGGILLPPSLTPSDGAPPPPPPFPVGKSPMGVTLQKASTKTLRQMHFEKLDMMKINNSMWKSMKDMTGELDAGSLEEHFVMAKATDTLKRGHDTNIEFPISTQRLKNLAVVSRRMAMMGVAIAMDTLMASVDGVTEDFQCMVESLKRCIPTKEEINECRPFINSRGGLGSTECFFLDLCCYELLKERLDLLLFLWHFSENQSERLIELKGVEQACVELVESKPFKYVLGNVLAVGNFLNSHTMKGVGIKGFKLSFLPKVVAVKGGKNQLYSVLDYIVHQFQIKKPEMLDFDKSVTSVNKYANISLKAEAASINDLAKKLEEAKNNLSTLSEISNPTKKEKKFLSSCKDKLKLFETNLKALKKHLVDAERKFDKAKTTYGEPVTSQSDEVFGYIKAFIFDFAEAKSLHEHRSY